MKLMFLRNVRHLDPIKGMIVFHIGEIFEANTDDQQNREAVFNLISNAQAVPADYPDPCEVKVLRSFHVADTNLGSFNGNAGETLDLPRAIALKLVCGGYAKPTNKKLWSFEFVPELPEDKIRKLYHQAEVGAMSNDGVKSSWLNRWREP